MTKREAENLMHQQNALVRLGFTYDEADQLRRISMTLRRWFERECGDSNDYASWCITRGRKVGKVFTYDDNGGAFIEYHSHASNDVRYSRIPDRETGARKRLAVLMAAHPGLTAYVQSDPRGCALYILTAEQLAGEYPIESIYNRGVAVG